MITTNDEQNNERRAQRRRTISPLPYVAPPPTPRSSFSRRLQRSSFLFPKTHSSPRMTNNSNWRRVTSDERHEPTQMNVRPVQLDTNRSNDGNGDNNNDDGEKKPGGLDFNRDQARTNESKKKKVRFRDEPTTAHCVDTPRASNLSVGEKRSMWYAEADFDAFKRDAARAAGVRIVRCRESKYHGKDADDSKGRFALLGNFDDKCDGGSGLERSGAAAAAKDDRPDAAKAAPPAAAVASAAEGKRYYNQNEYGDRRVPATDLEGGASGSASGGASGDNFERATTLVCKRGLGYHFSRARKRSRFLARSAVLAWQEALRDRAREEARDEGRASASSSSGGSDPKELTKASVSPKERAEALGDPNGDPRRDKSRVVLALVSSKCSRIAREEARWRGDVDYRVAHPDRRGRVGVGPARGKAKRRNGRSAGVSSDPRGRKRRKANVSARGGGGGGASRDDDGKREERLSPATIGYFVDVVLSA